MERSQQPSTLLRQSQTVPSLQFHVQSGKLAPGSPRRLSNEPPARPGRRKDNLLNSGSDSPLKAHVRRQDGRLQAYGWSLPSRQPGTGGGAQLTPTHGVSLAKGSATGVGVPVPVYCRPLEDQEPGMKIWCAAGVDLTGGQTKDGRSIVGSSVFYNPIPSESVDESAPEKAQDAVQSLAAELAESQWERTDAEQSERRLSSLVWIISSAAGKSRVNVIDSNRPGDVILTFDIVAANVLCIASVSGVKDNDYSPPSEDVERNGDPVESSGSYPSSDSQDGTDRPSVGSFSNIGNIRYVSCSVAGSDPLDQPKDNETDGKRFIVCRPIRLARVV